MVLKDLSDFITKIEEMYEACNSEKMVRDAAGIYSAKSILGHLIADAKELMKYGEYQIALENLLENLSEVSFPLDRETVDLARRAFGENFSFYHQSLLSAFQNADDTQ